MKKTSDLLAASALLALAAAIPANAQTTAAPAAPAAATPALVELDDDSATMVAPFNLSIDQMEDLDVVGADGAEIGEVEEVLGDASGTPTAVAIDFDDGFLGIGDTEAVVPLDQLTLQDGRLVSTLTAEQAEALPHWDD